MDSPLFLAIRLKSPKLLIDSIYRDRSAVAATDEAGRTPLHWAALQGSAGMLRALLDAGAPLGALDREGKTPVVLANEAGRSDAVRILAQAAERTGLEKAL